MDLNYMKRYTLVWQECEKDSKYSNRFFVPDYDGFLPFFLSGNEVDKLENKQPVELTEKQLLFGILFGLYEFENQPKPWHRPKDKSTLLYLLDVLIKRFNCSSNEQMILNVAATVRSENGNFPAQIILKTGNKLIPTSSKIPCDLINDLWRLSVDVDNKYLYEVLDYFKKIDLQEILIEAKEVVIYFGLVALYILEKNDQIPAFLEQNIYPHITNRVLKIKIKAMLESEKKMDIRQLDIQ